MLWSVKTQTPHLVTSARNGKITLMANRGCILELSQPDVHLNDFVHNFQECQSGMTQTKNKLVHS